MTNQPVIDEKTDLLFRMLRTIGLFAQTQLLQQPPKTEDQDQWTNTHAYNALNTEALQMLGPNAEAWVWARAIRLPHFSKDSATWIPLLWIENRPAGGVALQVVVAGRERRFGYRWEPPEGDGSGASDHDYFHAQPITSVRKPGGGVISLDVGHLHVCEHFPTFPLDAGDGLDLLDGLFVSLYGPKYTEKYIQDAGIRNQVHKSAENRVWARCRISRPSPVKNSTSQPSHGAKNKKNKRTS